MYAGGSVEVCGANYRREGDKEKYGKYGESRGSQKVRMDM